MNKLISLSALVVLVGVGLALFIFKKIDTPVFRVKSGELIGFVDVSRGNKEFYSFLGIPYAKAPVGELRFQPPQPPQPWQGILQATNFGSPCLQADSLSWSVIGTEDCLFINVFRPKHIPEGASLPVMVYVHGGYLMTGGGHNQQPHYFMDEQVIFVTFNYRLGALGFLSTLDNVIQGNNGLKDQYFALKWVKDNIQAFGGNPKQVTLFGESAGASSVHFHMLSPMSKGLFQRAISQSGTAFKIWSISTKPKEQSIRLGKRLNCPTESSQALVNCLKKLDAHTITETQIESITPLIDPLYMYAPVVESYPGLKDVFLPDHPYKTMVEGKYEPVPWICGVNSHEGLLVTARIALNQTQIHQLENDWKTYIPKYLVYPPTDVELSTKILNFYLGQTKIPEKFNFSQNFETLTTIVSDRLYIYAQREAALHHAKNADVFLYYNKYKGSQSFTIFFGFVPNIPVALQFIWKLAIRKIKRTIGIPDDFTGVSHGDDLFLMFKAPLMGINENSSDFHMSQTIINTWMQFARGEKTIMVKDKVWQPVARDTLENGKPLEYMTFQTSNEHDMKPEEFTQRMKFWKTLNLSWIT